MVRSRQGLPKCPSLVDKKALEHYQVSPEVTKLVVSHMDSLKMRFTVGDFTTKWQRLEKGIMAWCTISVVLFVAAGNLLLSAGGAQCRGPKADDGTRHPSSRAFMDDVMVMINPGNILDPKCAGEDGYLFPDAIQRKKIEEPLPTERKDDKQHLQYPRVRDSNPRRTTDPMPRKNLRQHPKGSPWHSKHLAESSGQQSIARKV